MRTENHQNQAFQSIRQILAHEIYKSLWTEAEITRQNLHAA